jgi:capsular polysaccharide biosynthesis protein
MGSLAGISDAATQVVKGNPALYVPIKRLAVPLFRAASRLAAGLGAFALARPPLTGLLLTPVRIDRVENLETTGELQRESIKVETFFPDEPFCDQAPRRLDGEQHWSLREYRSVAGRVAALSHGRFWLPGLAVSSRNRTYLSDLLHKLSVQAPESGVRSIPFIRARKLPGVTGLVAGNRPETYFHWMVEVAPKFLLLEAAGGWSRYDRLVVPPLTKRFQRETLDCFGVPKALLDEFQSSWLVEADELVVPFRSNENRMPVWLVREMAARFCQVAPPQDRLIYISRRDSPARRVENEDEVIACLAPFGFEVVTLSGMSVAAQAALFSSARVVVGPHGAGFANLLFCRPGAVVLEFFSPFYVNFCYWMLARGAQLSYTYILGEGPLFPDSVTPSLGSVPMRIPVKALRRALDQLLPGKSAAQVRP